MATEEVLRYVRSLLTARHQQLQDLERSQRETARVAQRMGFGHMHQDLAPELGLLREAAAWLDAEEALLGRGGP